MMLDGGGKVRGCAYVSTPANFMHPNRMAPNGRDLDFNIPNLYLWEQYGNSQKID